MTIPHQGYGEPSEDAIRGFLDAFEAARSLTGGQQGTHIAEAMQKLNVAEHVEAIRRITDQHHNQLAGLLDLFHAEPDPDKLT